MASPYDRGGEQGTLLTRFTANGKNRDYKQLSLTAINRFGATQIQDSRPTETCDVTICAVICGAARWVAIAHDGIANQAWLATFLELPQGFPSHDTLERLFAHLRPAHEITAMPTRLKVLDLEGAIVR